MRRHMPRMTSIGDASGSASISPSATRWRSSTALLTSVRSRARLPKW
jgi:hypothetical protein